MELNALVSLQYVVIMRRLGLLHTMCDSSTQRKYWNFTLLQACIQDSVFQDQDPEL